MAMLTEDPHTHVEDRDTIVGAESVRHGSGWMWLSILLAAALVGLGAWFIVDQTSSPATAPTDDIATLVDDYHDAWNNYDGDALVALVTDNFVFDDGISSLTAEQTANRIEALAGYDFNVAQLDEQQMVGHGPWYVSVANELTGVSVAGEGFSVLKIVDDAGSLKVAGHTYIGGS